ncbi:MAG: hypothetical protein LBB58_04660 [Cellulomonadaceae bacterium]|jgi:hypothetical protein|nr:hypothetical protein [Cellulomonadaceae bacterium]
MNKNTIRRLASSALAAALFAAPVLTLAPAATAATAPVGVVTLPAPIATPGGVTTLPAQVDPSTIVGLNAVPCTDLDARVRINVEGQENFCYLDRAELVRGVTADLGDFEAGQVRKVLVEDLNAIGIIPEMDWMAGSLIEIVGDEGAQPVTTLPIQIDPSEIVGRLAQPCEDLDPSVRVPVEGQPNFCYLDRSGLARDVAPVTVEGLDPNLGIVAISADISGEVVPVSVDTVDPDLGIVAVNAVIEPVSAEVSTGLAPASISAIAAGATVVIAAAAYVIARKRHA